MINKVDARNPVGSDQPLATQNDKSQGRRTLWFWRFVTFILPLVVIGAAIGAFVVMGALKPKTEEKTDTVKALPVLTAAAISENVVLKVNVQGEVQPRTQINLVPQVGGLITYMSPKFIEGGKFGKGDLLIRINPAEYELRVTQAKANVAQALTVLTREKSEAQMALGDWRDLGRSGTPPPLTLREPQLAEANAVLESAKARLAEAELQLDRTTLYAPFSGRVTTRNIDEGEFVAAGTPLGQIYSVDVMDVRLPLTNDDLRRAAITIGFEANGAKAALPVTLSADVGGIYSEWAGQIVRTDSRFERETRVLYAYAEVKDPFGSGASNGTPLAPGIFVNAAIQGQSLEDVLTIPRSALRGKNKVYLAVDGKLLIKTVNVISSDKNRAILDRGISSGDLVIMSPIRGVAEGMKIEIVNMDDTTKPLSSETGAP